MSRLYTTLAVVILALGATTGVAQATHSNGEGPDKDFGNGTGKAPLTIPDFGTFDTQQHVNGQNTSPADPFGGDGHFFTTLFSFFGPGQDLSVEGDITCLDAIGSHEINRGVVTQESAPLGLIGEVVIGKQIDNDLPSNSGVPDLTGGFILLGLRMDLPCPPAVIALPVTPVSNGNFVVHDGI